MWITSQRDTLKVWPRKKCADAREIFWKLNNWSKNSLYECEVCCDTTQQAWNKFSDTFWKCTMEMENGWRNTFYMKMFSDTFCKCEKGEEIYLKWNNCRDARCKCVINLWGCKFLWLGFPWKDTRQVS